MCRLSLGVIVASCCVHVCMCMCVCVCACVCVCVVCGCVLLCVCAFACACVCGGVLYMRMHSRAVCAQMRMCNTGKLADFPNMHALACGTLKVPQLKTEKGGT